MVAKIKYWFQNYWYYYKWPVILIAFFAAVILFCVVQSESREKADAYILYTGPYFFEMGEKANLENTFSQIMKEDYDGDGKKTISIVDMPAFSADEIKEAVGTSEDMSLMLKYAPYTYDEVSESFSQQVFAGETVICLLDPHWFALLKENSGLVPLEEVLGYKPEGMVDAYGVTFSTLAFSEFFDVAGKLPEDTVICFRRLSTASAFTGKEAAEKNYENSKKVLRDIFAFS